MIAELFYPSELKDVIENLGKKNDLNVYALRSLNTFIHKHIFGFILISAMLFYLGYPNFSILLFVMSPLFVCFDFRFHAKHKVMPFVTGKPAILKLVKRNSYRFGIILFLEYSNGKKYKTPKLPELSCGSDFTIIGRNENCYINTRFPKKCMPCEKGILKKYCLKKSMLEAEG